MLAFIVFISKILSERQSHTDSPPPSPPPHHSLQEVHVCAAILGRDSWSMISFTFQSGAVTQMSKRAHCKLTSCVGRHPDSWPPPTPPSIRYSPPAFADIFWARKLRADGRRSSRGQRKLSQFTRCVGRFVGDYLSVFPLTVLNIFAQKIATQRGKIHRDPVTSSDLVE